MDFKVIWSDEAIRDLGGICSYIARDNPEAALRMGNRVLEHVGNFGAISIHWSAVSEGWAGEVEGNCLPVLPYFL